MCSQLAVLLPCTCVCSGSVLSGDLAMAGGTGCNQPVDWLMLADILPITFGMSWHCYADLPLHYPPLSFHCTIGCVYRGLKVGRPSVGAPRCSWEPRGSPVTGALLLPLPRLIIRSIRHTWCKRLVVAARLCSLSRWIVCGGGASTGVRHFGAYFVACMQMWLGTFPTGGCCVAWSLGSSVFARLCLAGSQAGA